jgi:hypothetical protein
MEQASSLNTVRHYLCPLGGEFLLPQGEGIPMPSVKICPEQSCLQPPVSKLSLFHNAQTLRQL